MQADTLYIVLALVVAVVLHELAHGVVARLLGDRTAQEAGRLTLNPVKHVDPMGSIAVPLILAASQFATIGHVAFMYGWAKPVPVNPMQLQMNGTRHPRQLMAVVAVAGPVMNFILAILGGLLLYTNHGDGFCELFHSDQSDAGDFQSAAVSADGWRADCGGRAAAAGGAGGGAVGEIRDRRGAAAVIRAADFARAIRHQV